MIWVGSRVSVKGSQARNDLGNGRSFVIVSADYFAFLVFSYGRHRGPSPIIIAIESLGCFRVGTVINDPRRCFGMILDLRSDRMS